MLVKLALGLLLLGAVLFLSAGSMNYFNGWLFMLVLALPMIIFGLTLLIKDPSTLERRLKSKEPDKKQRAVVVASAAIFAASFVLSGLNYRFAWPDVPLFISAAAAVVILAGYAMFAAVIFQNSYAARTVDIHEGQKIITTGLYAFVRHPMYTATIVIYMSMPIILGSWIAALPMLLYPFIIVQRIKNEEALLLRGLDGYREYTGKVRYRLIPLVW